MTESDQIQLYDKVLVKGKAKLKKFKLPQFKELPSQGG